MVLYRLTNEIHSWEGDQKAFENEFEKVVKTNFACVGGSLAHCAPYHGRGGFGADAGARIL